MVEKMDYFPITAKPNHQFGTNFTPSAKRVLAALVKLDELHAGRYTPVSSSEISSPSKVRFSATYSEEKKHISLHPVLTYLDDFVKLATKPTSLIHKKKEFSNATSFTFLGHNFTVYTQYDKRFTSPYC